MSSQKKNKTLKKIELFQKDPFRIFFPLGGIFALCGVLIWLLHALVPDYFEYNVMLHKSVMIGGFISSIIAGFLLTAITRFTDTEYATKKELLFQIIVLLGSMISLFSEYDNSFYLGSTLFYISIARFAFIRVMKRKQNPPSAFIFVFLGIFMFILSSLCIGLNLASDYTALMEDIYYQGAILSLIIGVGSRLLPGILGHVEIVSQQRKQYEIESSVIKTIPKALTLLVILFLFSFFIEHILISEVIYGRLLRAIIIVQIAIQYWRIQKLPKILNILTIFLWLSAWGLSIGYTAYAFFPDFSISIIHFIYICGFSLMTIMISAKVSIAHGVHAEKKESNSKLLLNSGIMLLIAGITRATLELFDFYNIQIVLASTLWIAGIYSWLLFIFRKQE